MASWAIASVRFFLLNHRASAVNIFQALSVAVLEQVARQLNFTSTMRIKEHDPNHDRGRYLLRWMDPAPDQYPLTPDHRAERRNRM